jgi:hypothetical protein
MMCASFRHPQEETGAVGVTDATTVVGLHGQGGIGKSVLAAALARDEGVRRRFQTDCPG